MLNKNILIIEHNEKNLETLTILFQENGYNVFCIQSEGELDDFNNIENISLIIVNPYVNFTTICSVFELVDYYHSIHHPIVFIDSSHEHNKDKLSECYSYGAVDYIKKPFDSNEIVARIDLHISQYAKLTEYRLRLDKVIGLATTDQLSKFSSRMHMQAILKHTIELYDRHPSDTTIFYLKLLDVEKVVSTFGFEYGEKTIANFSKVLKKQLRESDIAGRWAGADFVILLPYTEEKAADHVVKKLYVNLSKTEIMENIKPNLSIGVTEIVDGDTINSILEKSKYAMQQASRSRYDRISRA